MFSGFSGLQIAVYFIQKIKLGSRSKASSFPFLSKTKSSSNPNMSSVLLHPFKVVALAREQHVMIIHIAHVSTLLYACLLRLFHRVNCIMDLLADLTIKEKIVTLFVIQQLFLFIHSFLKGEEFNAEKEKRRSYSRRKHCRRSS